ncbi:MAG: flagellar protein FlgN [Candidatus Tectomicrobia bacterium]|uniref:Flagellar protein FlgN n=1 Tax=Tectimicrobiota bacterium TaxID=2528274 RepID=A0A932I383_UNCTE|nr:flagellar protein FlgN [Candidatus Tectomicrobia bacterium]
MTKAISRLVEILEQEARLYGELTVLLEKEREAIRALDMSRLEEQLGAKAILIGRIQKLEIERGSLAATIGREQGIAGGAEFRLLDLVRRAPAPWAGRIMEVRLQLREAVERANEHNEGNRFLAEGLLGTMNGIMEHLKEIISGPSVYGRGGRKGAPSKAPGDFLRQAI